ncbi:Synaptotagmin-7 [Nymphon striatum]|nr:Synaptotagmin-7 [Nymphon striatum]
MYPTEEDNQDRTIKPYKQVVTRTSSFGGTASGPVEVYDPFMITRPSTSSARILKPLEENGQVAESNTMATKTMSECGLCTSNEFKDGRKTLSETPFKIVAASFVDLSRSESQFDEKYLDDTIFGHIEFKLQYKQSCKSLYILINKIVGLPCKGLQGSSYRSMVVVDTMPASEHIKSITRCSKMTLNPKFNQSFVYAIDLKKKKWQHRSLRFTVFEKERKCLEDCIGHALLPFLALEKHTAESYMYELPIKRECGSCHGEILIKFFYDSVKESLRVIVDKTKNLNVAKNMRGTLSRITKYRKKEDTANIYVKVTLRNSGEKIKTVRTCTMKGRDNMEFAQSFQFVLPLNYLNDSNVVFTVMQQTLIKSADIFIGRVVEGPFLYSHNNEVTLWGLMLRSRSVVSSWRKIYS